MKQREHLHINNIQFAPSHRYSLTVGIYSSLIRIRQVTPTLATRGGLGWQSKSYCQHSRRTSTCAQTEFYILRAQPLK